MKAITKALKRTQAKLNELAPQRDAIDRPIGELSALTGLTPGASKGNGPRMTRRRATSHLGIRAAALAALLLATATALHAQTSFACLMCHKQEDLETVRGGKTISLFVDQKVLAGSVHAKTVCVDCHADLKGADLPHKEGLLKKAVCGSCHEQEHAQHAASLHGQALAKGDPLAPSCADCHGGHGIVPVRSPASAVSPLRVPFVCGRCHQEGAPVQRQREIHQNRIIENYSESIHGEALLKKGLVVAANCASCHTAHRILPHTDSNSSIARANIAATCARCHGMIEQVHRKIIRGELWEKEAHVLPACVDCHQPHKVRKVFYDKGMADRDCLSCHAKADLRAADGRPLFVDAAEGAKSIHAKVACSQCHVGAAPEQERPCTPLAGKAVDCATCHEEMSRQYQESTHGRLRGGNDPNAPGCINCHGTHGVRGKRDPASPTFPTRVPDLCARCHREGEKAAVRYKGAEHDITAHYTESIHGKGLLKSGLVVTAMCTDCHTAHHELPAGDPNSSVNPRNVPGICGRCHHGIQEQFARSVHHAPPGGAPPGQDLPVCGDCHSAHTICRTDEAGFRLGIMATCGRCHAEVARTYFETYHGKVSQLGYLKTAKCADCHGAHEILRVNDPRSPLNRNNVVATCQKCHPGATRRFAGYLTHATHHDPGKYPWLFWTFWGMTALVAGTFIFFGLHTLLWLPRAFQMRRLNPHVPATPGERQFVRFPPLARILHGLMIASFMLLALTGMTLKFSYTGWAAVLSRLLGGFEAAGILHRTAALVMVGVFVTHLLSLLRRRRELGSWRALLFGPDTMLPTWKDVRDFRDTIRWFLGRGPRPQYGRWTYWEKFDYFAVFWGIAIIGSSGLMLWFPVAFTRALPGWLINVATIIHSDEALLATGFIFTIHFFNTHLRPEKFPMDLVIFTGLLPLEELKRDKPLEYAQVVASGKLEDRLAPPPDPLVVRTLRILAWTALGLGFGMVVWIVYAMVFAYR